MSEDQIKDWFGNEIKEIKESIKELGNLITNLRVELAEDYVRKGEYNERMRDLNNNMEGLKRVIDKVEDKYFDKIEEHKKEERSYNLKILGLGLTGCSSIFVIIQWVYNLASQVK